MPKISSLANVNGMEEYGPEVHRETLSVMNTVKPGTILSVALLFGGFSRKCRILTDVVEAIRNFALRCPNLLTGAQQEAAMKFTQYETIEKSPRSVVE